MIDDIVSVKSATKSGTFKEGKPHNFEYYRVVEKIMKGRELDKDIKNAKKTKDMKMVGMLLLARTNGAQYKSKELPNVSLMSVDLKDFTVSMYTLCATLST